MKYDFTSIIERHHMDSIAVDLDTAPGFAPKGKTEEGFDQIPMWVADMNFPTVPTIPAEIIARAQHPLYGYFRPTREYFDSIIRWQETHHHVTGLRAEHIGYENGVLGGVVSALNVFCSKGDNVLVNAPTYIGFTGSLENNGYHMIHSALYRDAAGVWRMNYDDMEKKIVDYHIHAAIVCSPYNPCGRVWTKEELEKVMAIFERHHVYIVSDEIWSDLMMNGHTHIPTQSVNAYAREHTVALYAPSKTFNLAGLIGSYHIIYNDWIRDRVNKEASLSHYNDMNVLSMHALIGAYKPEGYEWLKQLLEVLSSNVNYAYDYITQHFEGISVAKPEGTYMLLLDCEDWCKTHHISIDELQEKGVACGVIWQDARPFHAPFGIRMNLAVPHAQVIEAFRRLDQYVFQQK